MWPDRVGGIAATCAEAFRRINPVLAKLTGVCYWWGWVPTCGLTAILSAQALHSWYLPSVPVTPPAVVIVVVFMALNLAGVSRTSRVVNVIAVGAASLALLSVVVPLLHGDVDSGKAFSWNLLAPFHGVFGKVSSAMAGLYLIGFAAPAFEASTCHVGEMRDPARNLPRAMLASTTVAGLFFLVVPVVWLGKHTIVEFVEDQPTLDKLRWFGIDFAQGYHIGAPAPLPDIRTELDRIASPRVA